MLRYLLTFSGIQLVLFVLAALPTARAHLVLPWTRLLADTCALLVTQFDLNVVAEGKILRNPSSGFGVSIEAGCNGVEAYIVLIAAILAFPSTWKQRLWGLTLGFVAVQGLNVLRIISLFYLGQWNERAFHFGHTYLWQGLIMLDVLAFWLIWIDRCKKPTPPSTIQVREGSASL